MNSVIGPVIPLCLLFLHHGYYTPQWPWFHQNNAFGVPGIIPIELAIVAEVAAPLLGISLETSCLAGA